jgi:DNA-binding NarL/FixJ family response regulator
MTFNFDFLLPLFALTVAGLAVFRAICVQRKNRSLNGQLLEINGNLQSIHNRFSELQQKYNRNLEFHQNLTDAKITTRMQTPRLSLQTRADAPTAPERYRYVHRLAGNGMAAEEIASVLSISSHEARQLVNLARLAQSR